MNSNRVVSYFRQFSFSSLSFLEKFGLVTGIIGLIADLIGLFSFIVGLWQPSSIAPGTNSFNIILALGICLFYGWLMIAGVISRRYYANRQKGRKPQNLNSVIGAVIGIGIFILPMCCCWVFTWTQNTNQNHLSTYKVEAQFQATRLALLSLTPTRRVEPTTPTPTPVILKSPEQILNERLGSNYLGGFVFTMSCLMFIGMMVTTVLLLLLPVIYPDMPEFDWAKLKKLISLG